MMVRCTGETLPGSSSAATHPCRVNGPSGCLSPEPIGRTIRSRAEPSTGKDTNASGTVDSSDPWYWYVQDSRWRTAATFRASAWGFSGSNDTNPKETTIYHAAGLGGRGGSSYIDGVILADKDMTNGWGGAADGTREKRVYLLQNWRADVSCVTDQNGKVVEWVKYSPYGVPFRIDPADVDRDGVVDSSDSSAFTTEYNNGGPRADANHDGFIDFTDFDVYDDNYNAATAGGRNVLSRGGATSAGIHNRIGYAGYLWDSATSQYHVRNRVFLPSLGRWNRRDPIGYVDGLSVYEYVQDMPVNAVDPQGLKLCVWCGDRCCTKVITGTKAAAQSATMQDGPVRCAMQSSSAPECACCGDPNDPADQLVGGCTRPDPTTGEKKCCICDLNKAAMGYGPGNVGPCTWQADLACNQQHEARHVNSRCVTTVCAACEHVDIFDSEIGCLEAYQRKCGSSQCKADYNCTAGIQKIIDRRKDSRNFWVRECARRRLQELNPNDVPLTPFMIG